MVVPSEEDGQTFSVNFASGEVGPGLVGLLTMELIVFFPEGV